MLHQFNILTDWEFYINIAINSLNPVALKCIIDF